MVRLPSRWRSKNERRRFIRGPCPGPLFQKRWKKIYPADLSESQVHKILCKISYGNEVGKTSES